MGAWWSRCLVGDFGLCAQFENGGICEWSRDGGAIFGDGGFLEMSLPLMRSLLDSEGFGVQVFLDPALWPRVSSDGVSMTVTERWLVWTHGRRKITTTGLVDFRCSSELKLYFT
ncbi:hypothetical protein F2Q69_00030557 [Brassica cretica]|uniref:Uncharacterized protein n=1 Tax=Brassica cretica TaxID=69181 RepID=A0A8S9RRV4_BRACR|nr:hypothetical protein F2Q69_00030557 [Brassica cretica]